MSLELAISLFFGFLANGMVIAGVAVRTIERIAKNENNIEHMHSCVKQVKQSLHELDSKVDKINDRL